MPFDISIKKVAVAGGSGNLGSAVVEELLKSSLFDITILSRSSSSVRKFPQGVKVIQVDFENLESLKAALAGQDAVVSTVGSPAIASQKLLIDAAIEAGVKRFIPSEFGSDLYNPETRALPVYAAKVKMEEYLEEAVKKHNFFSYTLIFNGLFLDYDLKMGLFFNFKERKAEIYDGGDQPFTTTRLAVVGKAVRRVLTHPRETADRAIRVKDIDVTQNELLKLAQSFTGGEKWDVKQLSTNDLEKGAMEKLRKNEADGSTMLSFIKIACFRSGYGGAFESCHNNVLGIKGMTEPDLEELMASVFGRV